MTKHFWNLLALEPTQDVTAIKGAYARQARRYHPEEDPAMFLELRKAYEAALDWAKLQQTGDFDGMLETASPDRPPEISPLPEPSDDGWRFPDELPDSGPNPYQDHEANLQFIALYSGKQRKNSKSWMDYFTSPVFLDAAYNSSFTALLLQNVTDLEAEYPPTKEFLTWLYAAYQFTATVAAFREADGSDRREIRFQLYENSRFDGIDSIFQIALKGPIPKRPTGNELAILTSFCEYRHLIRLAEKASWSDKEINEYHHIIGRYNLAYLKDKCTNREQNVVERHPASLRLLLHFFQNYPLPEELYRILWEHLKLKDAVMGRTKIFFGALRELVLARVPSIEHETAKSFMTLHKAFTQYGISFRSHGGKDLQRDQEEVDAFFAREDFNQALQTRRFVENNILSHWVTEYQSNYYLQRIIDFYTHHENAPCAKRVIERAKEKLRLRFILQQTEEDKAAFVPDNLPNLAFRPFFRHWLNTSFYQAHDPDTGLSLSEYLTSELPYLPEWSRRFLAIKEDNSIPTPRSITVSVKDRTFEIRFHLRYTDFLVNGELVYRPFLDFDWLATLEDNRLFLLLLPITVSDYRHFKAAKIEIEQRLADTAADPKSRNFIAACLAGQVCCRPVPENPPESEEAFASLPYEFFMEDTEQLYGCSWFEDEQILLFFEQTPTGRRIRTRETQEQVYHKEMAIRLAQKLLTEVISPSGIHADLFVPLPEAVYAVPDFAAIVCDPDRVGSDMPKALLDHQVTYQQLTTLLTLFADGKVNRLELSWSCTIPMSEHQGYAPRRSLVLIKDSAGFACFYFDDNTAQSYALLSKPELYWQDEAIELSRIPFRQGMLFPYHLHSSFATIRPHLDTIFRQACHPNGITLHAARLWSSIISIRQGRCKYNLDKQLLGGFPMEWAHNRLTAKFYLEQYPVSFTSTDQNGQCQTLPIGGQNRIQLQDTLLSLIQGKLKKLLLTWESEKSQRHLILLEDQNRFMMAYLDDSKRQAVFYVADQNSYMKVEGKKYPKDTFLGRTTPAYLIHADRTVLRNGLDLMLATINDPSPILNRFAAFALENPVKQRPYEEIWAALAEGMI